MFRLINETLANINTDLSKVGKSTYLGSISIVGDILNFPEDTYISNYRAIGIRLDVAMSNYMFSNYIEFPYYVLINMIENATNRYTLKVEKDASSYGLAWGQIGKTWVSLNSFGGTGELQNVVVYGVN